MTERNGTMSRARSGQRKEDAVTDPPAVCLPATIAWSATEADAYGEAPLPDAFCVQLVVLNGERHIYRLHRRMLVELSDRISQILAKIPTPLEKRCTHLPEEAKGRIGSQVAELALA